MLHPLKDDRMGADHSSDGHHQRMSVSVVAPPGNQALLQCPIMIRLDAAMARLGAAVNIVTTDGRAGRAGFTASAVCSVNQQSADLAGVRERAIGPTRAAVAAVRRRDSSRERFAAATWSTLETGAPVLADCAAAFDCRVVDVANVARMTSRFARDGAAEVGLCGQLDLFCRDYHIVRACPA